MQNRLGLWGLLLLALASVTACMKEPSGGSVVGGICTPGQSGACACVGGGQGAQICQDDNTFGPCVCAEPDGGEVSDARADADASTPEDVADEGGSIAELPGPDEGDVPADEASEAEVGPQPGCALALVPETVEFGLLAPGTGKSLAIRLVSVGDGPCVVEDARPLACAAWSGPDTTSCPDPLSDAPASGSFAIVQGALDDPATLQPGERLAFVLRFDAPSLETGQSDHAALFAVRFRDPADPAGSLLGLPAAAGGAAPAWTPNLHARTGASELLVSPDQLDLGRTTVGCDSERGEIGIFAAGDTPLVVSGWDLLGCPPELSLVSSPACPGGSGGCDLTLTPGEGGATFEVVHQPASAGLVSCALAIYLGAAVEPAAIVPIGAEGLDADERTDTWVQEGSPPVDILFVIDGSGSMAAIQAQLAQDFQTFATSISAAGPDIHCGGTTVDADERAGALVGDPPWVELDQIASCSEAILAQNEGYGFERGLEAARLALSPPMAASSDIPCEVDGDCPGGPPIGCHAGRCAGPNSGFMRPDGRLELVFVSDEEDQSPSSLAFYEAFFLGLHALPDPDRLHAHAIVGPPGGCSGGGVSAEAGLRYLEIAAATGGEAISICDAALPAGFEAIAESASAPRTTFPLSAPAEPGTLAVAVEGADCPAVVAGASQWSYDAALGAVLFEKDAGCFPATGETVTVSYRAQCSQE